MRKIVLATAGLAMVGVVGASVPADAATPHRTYATKVTVSHSNKAAVQPGGKVTVSAAFRAHGRVRTGTVTLTERTADTKPVVRRLTLHGGKASTTVRPQVSTTYTWSITKSKMAKGASANTVVKVAMKTHWDGFLLGRPVGYPAWDPRGRSDDWERGDTAAFGGRLVDVNSRPVVGQRVQLVFRPDSASGTSRIVGTATTDKGGWAQWTNPGITLTESGNLQLVHPATSTYAASSNPSTHYDVVAPLLDATLDAAPFGAPMIATGPATGMATVAGTIKGHEDVRDPETPVSTIVSVWDLGCGCNARLFRPVASTVSDSDGRFSFDLPPGHYQLHYDAVFGTTGTGGALAGGNYFGVYTPS